MLLLPLVVTLGAAPVDVFVAPPANAGQGRKELARALPGTTRGVDSTRG